MPDPLDIIVIDVAFISLTLILPPAAILAKPATVIVPLIKPQFELRKDQVGRGVVREAALHAEAVAKIRGFVERETSLVWSGCIESPIRGGEGNVEYLACLRAASV